MNDKIDKPDYYDDYNIFGSLCKHDDEREGD